jgi:hypothetical protein
VAKGFVLEVPDLRHAGDRALNSFYDSVRQFLPTLEESTRAQFRDVDGGSIPLLRDLPQPILPQARKLHPIGQFREDESVQQNCWHQGVQGRNFGVFADGFYHNLIILKRRPQRTRRGIFWALTSLPFRDYTITVNLYPQNVRTEIDGTEKSLERVRGDYRAEGKHSLLTSKEVKEQRINELARGDVTAMKFLHSILLLSLVAGCATKKEVRSVRRVEVPITTLAAHDMPELRTPEP